MNHSPHHTLTSQNQGYYLIHKKASLPSLPLKRPSVTSSGHHLVGHCSSAPLQDSSQFCQQLPLARCFPPCHCNPPLPPASLLLPYEYPVSNHPPQLQASVFPLVNHLPWPVSDPLTLRRTGQSERRHLDLSEELAQAE